MKTTGITRWFILLLALVCAVQAASAFEIIKEEIKPESKILEPGQNVNAQYVFSYNMVTTGSNFMDDEKFEFSTGLEKAAWDFKIRREGYPDIVFPTRGGIYQTLLEFEVGYSGDVHLDVQLRGTVPKTSLGKLEIVKIEHFRDKSVVDEYRMTRDVVNEAQIEGSLSAQQQRLKDLKTEIDEKSTLGVDVSTAQNKYNAASQALTSAASAAPSQAAGYISTATEEIDGAKALLDQAWAEKMVADTGASIESLDELITYFVENRSMGSDPQVIAITTKRETAVQFYTQAQDNLDAKNYPLARTKADDGLKKANDALNEATALRERIGDGFNLGGNLLLYIGIGVVLILIVVGAVFYRKKTGWDELG